MSQYKSFLKAGEFLRSNDYLMSNNGQYMALMQGDGNFVLYHVKPNTNPPQTNAPYWASGTARATSQYYAIMQGDGNFVLYPGSDPDTNQGAGYWSSKTVPGAGAYYAELRDDGDFVLSTGSDPSQPGKVYWSAYPQVAVESKLMDGFNTFQPVNGTDDIVAVQTANHGMHFFTVGTNQNIYQFYPDQSADSGYSSRVISKALNATALAAYCDEQDAVTVFVGSDSVFFFLTSSGDLSEWTLRKLDSFNIPQAYGDLIDIHTQLIGNDLYLAIVYKVPQPMYRILAAKWEEESTLFLVTNGGNPLDNPNLTWWPHASPEPYLVSFKNSGGYFYLTSVGNKIAPNPIIARMTPDLCVMSVDTLTTSSGTDQTFALLRDANGNKNPYYLTGGQVNSDGMREFTWKPLGTQVSGISYQKIVAQTVQSEMHLFTVSDPMRLPDNPDDTKLYNILYHWTPESEGGDTLAADPNYIFHTTGLNLGVEVNTSGNLEAFVVDGENQITWLYKEQESTNWTTQQIDTDDGDLNTYIPTYATDISLSDYAGASAVGYNVLLKTNEDARITINGKTFFVGPHQPASLQTNTAGMLTLYQTTETLASPSISINIPDLMLPSEVIVINPFADVQNYLGTVVTADKISQATDRNGAPLLPANYNNDETTKSLAEACHQCMALVGPPPTAIPLTNAVTRRRVKGGVWRQSHHIHHHPGRIKTTNTGEHWQLDFTSNEVIYQPLTQKQAHTRLEAHRAIRATTGLPKWLTDIGDFFRGVGEKIVNVVEIVVDGITASFQFIFEQITYAFEAVIQFIDQAFDVIEMIFNTIQIFFEKLFEWLAWLFMKADIIRTKNAIVYIIQQSLSFLSEGAQSMQQSIDSWLESFIKSFDQNMNDAIQNAGSVTIGGYEESQAGTDEDLDQGMANNFVLAECLSHDIPDISAFFVGTADDDPVTVFLNMLAGVATTIQNSGPPYDSAVEFFSGIASDRDSIFSALVSKFYKIVQNLADIALDSLKLIVDQFFAILTTVLSSIQDLLKKSWYIPFVSKFYTWMFGGDLRALDLVALIAAIPVTITYKIKYKQAPFPTDADETAFENSYTLDWLLQQFGFSSSITAEANTSSSNGISNQRLFGILYGIANGLSGVLTTVLDAQDIRYQASSSVTALGLILTLAGTAFRNPAYFSTEEEETLKAEKALYITALVLGVAGLFVVYVGVKWFKSTYGGVITNMILAIVMTVGGCILLVPSSITTSKTSNTDKKIWYMMAPWPLMMKFLKLIPSPYATAALCIVDVACYGLTTYYGAKTIIES